jgi:hypothetical protein
MTKIMPERLQEVVVQVVQVMQVVQVVQVLQVVQTDKLCIFIR